jgi:hypothetical protein
MEINEPGQFYQQSESEPGFHPSDKDYSPIPLFLFLPAAQELVHHLAHNFKRQ